MDEFVKYLIDQSDVLLLQNIQEITLYFFRHDNNPFTFIHRLRNPFINALQNCYTPPTLHLSACDIKDDFRKFDTIKFLINYATRSWNYMKFYVQLQECLAHLSNEED